MRRDRLPLHRAASLRGVMRIIVLGMHRSGTSALTRAIGLLGASMGDETHLGKHWENVPLRHLNENLMAQSGGRWDSPPASPDWLASEQTAAFAADACTTFDTEFGTTANVSVWKDPRTCVTLPFWLDRFDDDPVLLFVYRHPTEVAASLAARNDFGTGQAYALWERYNADALRAAQGLPTIVLGYADVVTNPGAVLSSVAATLASWGAPLPNDAMTTDTGLVPQQRHHTASSASCIEDDIATRSQRELWDLLRRIDGAHRKLVLPAPVSAASPLSAEILALAGKLRAATQERKSSRRSAGTRRSTRRRGDEKVSGSADAGVMAHGKAPP